MNKLAFDSFALNDNRYEIRLENYTLTEDEDKLNEECSEEFLVHQKLKVTITEPRICTWDYLTKEEITTLLNFEKGSEIRNFFTEKIRKSLKGPPKIIFRELMYSVTKFCKKSKFDVEQTGTVLSELYLTHLYFTSSLDIGPEKLYQYFKEMQFCHSLPFPPKNTKLFNLEETKQIMVYFSRLYLRNLPIIRFLALPNFTLKVNYEIEPEKPIGKKKKGKKDKKKKKKKK